VKEDRGTVGGEEWQEKVYNREEWKELLRAAGNCQIVRVAVGWVDGIYQNDCLTIKQNNDRKLYTNTGTTN
jgi:hypothetical protein